MADIYHYKIRNKRTGLYKVGTSHTRWSKNGKTWTSLSAFMSHLALYRRSIRLQNQTVDQYKIGDEWEVIKILINPDSEAIDIAEFIKGRKPNALIVNDSQQND